MRSGQVATASILAGCIVGMIVQFYIDTRSVMVRLFNSGVLQRGNHGRCNPLTAALTL